MHTRWFPGCHYDLGRQRFRFFRYEGHDPEVDHLFGGLSEIIEPNQVFADIVLKWILESIKEHSNDGIITDIDTEINTLNSNMGAAGVAYAGTGDVYSNILQYGPLGTAWTRLIDTLEHHGEPPVNAITNLQPIARSLWVLAKFNVHVFDAIIRQARPLVEAALVIVNNIFNPNPFGGNSQGSTFRDLGVILSSQFLLREFRIITDVLAQTRDRRISDVSASVTRYDRDTLGQRTIGDLGRINRPANQGGYMSQTYEDFKALRRIM